MRTTVEYKKEIHLYEVNVITKETSLGSGRTGEVTPLEFLDDSNRRAQL